MIIFFLKAVLFSASILTIVGLTTYTKDPSRIFDQNNKYERKISTYLLQGEAVANVSDYNDRLVQRFYIEGLVEKKETIIIGSSRSMQIGENIIKSKSVYNASLSAVMFEDFISIYSMLKFNNKLPQRIILNLDPYSLNATGGNARWKHNEDYYEAFVLDQKYIQKVNLNRLTTEEALQAFMPDYFQASIKSESPKVYPTDDPSPKEGMVSSTGMLLYPERKRKMSPEKVDEEALELLQKEQYYHFKDFREFDEERTNLLKKLIRDCKENGVQLVLLLVPTHPRFYERYKNRSPISIKDVEYYYNKIARDENVDLIGTYSPYKYNLKKEDFMDLYHPKRESVETVFKMIKATNEHIDWLI